MNVLVTGGTGFVGSYLVGLLVARDDRVTVVSRSTARVRGARASVRAAEWLPDLSAYDAIVHLAGEPIFGKRWSKEQKQNLRASRISSTKKIVDALADLDEAARPKTLVSASAIGYYGSRKGETLDESAGPGNDFLAGLCVDWEAEAQRAEELGVRVVQLRIGIVLGADGGALASLLPPFRMYAGGPIGLGGMYWSWIHQEDLGRLILHVIDSDSARGPINAVSPNPVTNRAFAKALGKVLRRPSFMPAPPLALKLLLGGAAEALTADQRVTPKKAGELGFEFQHPEIVPALEDLLQRYLIDQQV